MESAKDRIKGSWVPVWVLVCVALLVAIDSLDRAVRHSYSNDEALSYGAWIAKPWSSFYQGWVANHHLLSNAASKVLAQTFGPSEWVLRLPAVFGGGLWLGVVSWFAFATAPRSWAVLLAALACMLNPFLRDWMVAARGYGLALGLLGLTLALSVSALSGQGRACVWKLVALGTAAGLCAGANLACVFALAGLAGALLLRVAVDRNARRDLGLVRLVSWALLPAIFIAIGIYAPAFGAQVPDYLRFGQVWGGDALLPAVFDLVRGSLVERRGAIGSGIVIQGVPLRAVEWGFGVAAPLFLVVSGCVALWGGARGTSARSRTTELVVLAGTALGLTVLLHAVAHVAFGVAWPLTRTAIPLVVFVSLGWIGITALAARSRRRYLVLAPASMTALAVVLFCANGARPDHFRDWPFDRDARNDLAWIVQRREAVAPGAEFRVLCLPFHRQAALRFYAERAGADWLVVDTVDPRTPESWTDAQNRYDVYALWGGPALTQQVLALLDLVAVRSDPAVRTTLAVAADGG